jgi:hypothetical protein
MGTVEAVPITAHPAGLGAGEALGYSPTAGLPGPAEGRAVSSVAGLTPLKVRR